TEECTATVANSILLGADARQSLSVLSRSGSLDLFGNTIVGGRGAAVDAGVIVQGGAAARIVNNVIARREGKSGTALVLSPGVLDASGALVLTNSFSGWDRLARLEEWDAGANAPTRVAEGVDALNGIDISAVGGRVSGNIAEDPGKSFGKDGAYRLVRDSACVDAGTDLLTLQATTVVQLDVDFDGSPRPAKARLVSPGPPRGWDIGAREYSD
ncbi:MAG TPA: hypothetical protein VHE79_16230, partial [Spirochaetia bacterium]